MRPPICQTTAEACQNAAAAIAEEAAAVACSQQRGAAADTELPAFGQYRSKMNPVIVHADYCRRRWSNDLPILPADGLCFPRQSHSSYHLDAFSSTWNINGVHTFHRRTRRKYQGTC